MNSKSLVVVVSIAVAVLLPSVLMASTIYSEDFESVSPGTAITDPSLGWIDALGLAGVPAVQAGLNGWSGNAVSGSILEPTVDQYWYYISLPLPTTRVLQYEAKAYATSGGAGTHTSIGIGGGETYRLLRAGWRTQPDGWMFDIRPTAGWVEGNYQEIIDSSYLNTTVTAKVIIDLDGKSIWGVLDNGTTSIETNHISYTGTPDFGSVIYGPDYRNSWVGIDIDDIKVSALAIATLSGHVDLANYSGDSTLAPVKIELMPTSQGSAETRTVTLDSGGNYSIAVVEGTYDIAFSACKWLRNIVQGVVVSSTGGTCDVSLVNGDIDGDNAVTSTDMSVLLSSMDLSGE